MPARDLIVIGASTGGIAALARLVAGLPPAFPASVFVVCHLPPDYESVLPRILSREGRLLPEDLADQGIKQLVVCGVTTEVCVHTSVREANDRGYDALVLSDCVGSYFPEFQRVALEMIKAQGGIFGWVSDSERFLRGLATATGRTPAAAGAAVA